MTWGAVAVGGATLVGSYISSEAAKDAAAATSGGADAAAKTNRYMYDTTREDQAPYRTVGTSALNRMASMYGLDTYQDPENQMLYMPGGELFRYDGKRPRVNELLYQEDPVYRQAWDETAAELKFKNPKGGSYKTDIGRLEALLQRKMEASPVYRQRIAGQTQRAGADGDAGRPVNDWSSFYDSPDYKFAFDEGNRAVNAGLAARGLSNSGAAMKELTRYGQGMASQQLNTYMNRLASLAGIGQTATQATGAAGANAAQGIGQAQMAAGDARASGYMNRASNINNLINQGTGMYMMSQLGGGGSGITQIAPQTYTTGTGYARIGG